MGGLWGGERTTTPIIRTHAYIHAIYNNQESQTDTRAFTHTHTPTPTHTPTHVHAIYCTPTHTHIHLHTHTHTHMHAIYNHHQESRTDTRAFDVLSAAKSFTLVADTAAAAREWVRALKEAIAAVCESVCVCVGGCVMYVMCVRRVPSTLTTHTHLQEKNNTMHCTPPYHRPTNRSIDRFINHTTPFHAL